MKRILWILVIALLILAAPASLAINHFPTVLAAGSLSTRVHIFYYPWYGLNPYRHWPQGGHTPPNDIGSNFYPVLGPYDSGDFAGAVTTHMQQIQQAGAGVVVLSWWGQGSFEDDKTIGIMDKANLFGIKVAFHIEPYGSRTPSSVVSDVNYINSRYGSHPAYYRDATHGNRPAFYIFETYRSPDWSPVASLKANNILLIQTAEDTSQAQYFGGIYTYDGIAGTFVPGWAVSSAYAHAHGLVWAPSVAPGYLDDRAVPGNTTPTVNRNNGAAYDSEWNNVLNPANGQADWVSVTSFNEWHEGSQIEPARNTPPSGFGYLTYLNAYGKTGTAAEQAYLDRTRFWADTFDPQGSSRPGAPSMLRATEGNGQISLTWSAGSGATSYAVKRSTTPGGTSYTTIQNVAGTSYTDTGLANGTPYYYAVWAVNANGSSAQATNEASGVPFSGVNLVPNPEFENGTGGDAANWTEGVDHARSTGFKNGNWSLRSGYMGSGTAQTLSGPIAISANTTYTLSGWVYVFKQGSPGRACIDMNGLAGAPQLCTTTTFAQLSGWKYLAATWNSGTNTSVVIRLLTDNNPMATWFEDIRLSNEGGPTSTPAPPTTTPTKTPTPTITNTPLPGGSNLVLNPGFETAGAGGAADAADWNEGTNHTRAADRFHTGAWSLKSAFTGAGTDTRSAAAIAVSPGTVYTYSGWIWKASTTGAAYYDMNDSVGETTLMSSTTGSWQFLSGTWNSGTNTSVTLRAVTDGAPTGNIWFDDISLAAPGGPTNTPTRTPTRTTTPTRTSTFTRTPTPTNTLVSANLVVNPSFETAGTGGAADAAGWTEGVNHTRASDRFHTGTWSLKSTYTGAGTDTRTTLPIAVIANHAYTYSGWIWRASTTGGSCMDMNDITGELTLCTTTTGSWQFKSGTWNSGANTSVTLRLITDGAPTGNIWFDDVSFQ